MEWHTGLLCEVGGMDGVQYASNSTSSGCAAAWLLSWIAARAVFCACGPSLGWALWPVLSMAAQDSCRHSGAFAATMYKACRSTQQLVKGSSAPAMLYASRLSPLHPPTVVCIWPPDICCASATDPAQQGNACGTSA